MAQKIVQKDGEFVTEYDFEGVDLVEYSRFQKHVNGLMEKPVEQNVLLALYHLFGENGITDEQMKKVILFGKDYYF